MNPAIMKGVIRHALTTLGGGALAGGYMTESDVTAIAGAISTLIGFAMSLIAKRRAAS